MTHTYDDEQVAMNGIYPSTPEKETPTPKTVEEVAREINNGLASMLTPSNEAMSACRWVKKEIEKALTAQNQAADERLREVFKEILAKQETHMNDGEWVYHGDIKEIAAKHGITNL